METSDQAPFWDRKTLPELNPDEWEALCDGCALCCLQKVQDEETEEVFYTDIACRLLDTNTCRCTDYERRTERVRDCLVLSVDRPEAFQWLPASCAYRRLASGQSLPAWHPLITGDPDSVVAAGISARFRISDTNQEKTSEPGLLFKLD